ncbi:uncharacterized protein LOC110604865 [Manihot esculenta]|uniref:uncharacterized protein LOC110604865 n=1 Tax=Manihot esculenta TaxID=3983 RepID=UPI000B5D8563|nr:uncharacterized protein LOC110604865 [Manihot esculenta]
MFLHRCQCEGEDANDESSSTSRVVVFASGAAAPSSSDWMIRYFWWKKISGFFQTREIGGVSQIYPEHLLLAGKAIGSRGSHDAGFSVMLLVAMALAVLIMGLLFDKAGIVMFLETGFLSGFLDLQRCHDG